MNNQPTEAEIRALRDRVYCIPITDNEWEKARSHWMSREGISFLRAHDFPISETLRRRESQPK